MSKRITSFLFLVLAAALACASDDEQQAAALKYVAEQLVKHAAEGEVWEFQSIPPKEVIDFDSQKVLDFHAYLKEKNPDLLQKLQTNETKAKYKAMFVFKNRDRTQYKVVHYFEIV